MRALGKLVYPLVWTLVRFVELVHLLLTLVVGGEGLEHREPYEVCWPRFGVESPRPSRPQMSRWHVSSTPHAVRQLLARYR